MSYLARLKQLEADEIFHHVHDSEPTKPTEPPFDGFVGSILGANENIFIASGKKETTHATSYWHWLLHFADRDPLEVYFNPDASFDKVMTDYPDALGATPIPVRPQQEFTAAEDEQWNSLWLDPVDYWDGLSEDVFTDDRRRCTHCIRLNPLGRCIAAERGEIAASQIYTPIKTILRRCEGYAPLANDPDQRTGAERWPRLIQKEGE